MPRDCSYHLNRFLFSPSGNLRLISCPPLCPHSGNNSKKKKERELGAKHAGRDLICPVGMKEGGRKFLCLESRECLFRLSANKGTITC